MKFFTFHIIILSLFLIGAAGATAQSSKKIKKTRPTQKENTSKVAANYGRYNFSFKSLDGKTVRLTDYSGKVILVNIWAPWCEPCKKEAEGFAKLYGEFHSKGFNIMGIAVQTTEGSVRSFMQNNHVTWSVGIKDEITDLYRAVGLPQSYLFNRDGSLVKEFVGYTAEEALRQQLELIFP